jgi:hypothetical protein
VAQQVVAEVHLEGAVEVVVVHHRLLARQVEARMVMVELVGATQLVERMAQP